jgi:hypothetical protein
LGWKPKLSIDKTLKLIIDWEKSRLNNIDIHQTTLQQIKDYQEMVAH